MIWDDGETEGGGCDIPLPEGARVRQLDDDLVLIELPIPEPGRPAALTCAEMDVARRVFEGDTSQAIADARGVSVKTVSKQLEAIYRKLGVGSRSELVLHLRRVPAPRD